MTAIFVARGVFTTTYAYSLKGQRVVLGIAVTVCFWFYASGQLF